MRAKRVVSILWRILLYVSSGGRGGIRRGRGWGSRVRETLGHSTGRAQRNRRFAIEVQYI